MAFAETVASALLGVIFDKLANEAFNKYVRSQGIHSELKTLEKNLRQIQALLNDASRKEIKDEAVNQWLIDLQHLAYDIDDVLDDVASEAMHRELNHKSGAVTSNVRKLIPTCCTNFSLTHRLHRKLDGITAELEHLYKAKSDLGLTEKDEKPEIANRRNETSLLESNVIGREVEKEKLLKKLLHDDEPSKENFSIIPIVGMGGVGKTTLARLLYNDTQVKDAFELHAWVCVSDDFDISKISKTIFQHVSEENKEFEDLNKLQVALKDKLKDKRFLLVLDDVWNQNFDEWDKLVRPLSLVAPGSKIIVTTREDHLLKKLGFDHLDHLESLTSKDALSLLAIHALGAYNFDLNPKLRGRGEDIVKKCGCLPLAIKAVGRLLSSKTNGEDWDEVLSNEIWDLESSEEIVPALRLSYHYLSANLKQLFAYCSLFPKDFLFDKENLVLLWMAEGYLNQLTTNKSPEQLGHEYFEKLLSRSFFQHATNHESLFVMHDLMNDLATFVSRDYFLRFEKQMEEVDGSLAKYRHMSFIREEYVGYQKFEAFKRAKSLRTFLAVYVGVDQSWNRFFLSNKILVDVLPELSLLRVLCLSCFEIIEVPEFIGSLKHLRYLNLSQTKIKELPENVGNLYNLETLIIFECKSLTKLPKSFSKLKKLRHLDMRDTLLLKKLPLGIDELRSLHTLTKIIVGGDGDFAISDLKGLKKLHGEISIEGLHKVQSPMNAREASLNLKRLTKLELKWDDGYDQVGTLEKEVLNELKPNSERLKVLSIVSYGGVEFSNWVGDPSFQQLVHVSISGCRKCTSLPPLEKLPSLKELFIQGMDNVKSIGLGLVGTTTVAFPSLEILRFEDMRGWEVWSTSSKDLNVVFPCLRKLHINNCPNLIDVSLKAIPSLRVLEIKGCGDGLLRNLVEAASLVVELDIRSISRLTNEKWRGVMEYLGAVEELYIWECNEIRYLWESEAAASKVLMNLKDLRVFFCNNLMSLGEKEDEEDFGSNILSSLKTLVVWNCNSMVRCWCPNSNNIERLDIFYCNLVTSVYFPTTTRGG
ncbi:hypothetical protein SSX86_014660 [Deinandra increscens subsp. villosa]|uniref:NB-ARC n=1 Tax=Deinandra increscens subsp. villosa TaxID=3103831 RepID=A0AAP0H004_9ASTR